MMNLRSAGLRLYLGLASFVVGSATLTFAPSAQAAQTVSCANSATTTVCTINQPIVTQRLTTYPQITFKAGDVVTVSAGGCVQTGGSGKTWKRYVNPSGSNADRLYHGLIQIPGVQSDLVRIQGVVLHPLVVPGGPSSSGANLRLGYEDDGYSDNGYWGHDDGTENQCKGVGDAFVRISIQHNGPKPTASAAPFDLVSASTDANDFPLNPEWAWQKQTGQLPDADKICFPLAGDFNNPSCTTQTPSQDNPSGLSTNNAICAIGAQHSIHGHVNWMPATMQGTLVWDNHSGGLTGDDDYNINIQTPGHLGETASNGGHIHTEFDSDETIDHFHTPVWNAFHSAVDADDTPTGRPAQMINGRLGFIIGLVGLDCEHACATELHPVYGLAMNVQGSDANDDEWAIFVRNSGDEGYCSQYQHFLDTSRMAFIFPAPSPLATGVTVGSATVFKTNNSQAGGPSVTFLPGQGALVVFTLPDPSQKARIDGELHLTWTVPAGQNPARPAPVRRLAATVGPAAEQGDVEDRLRAIEGKLPAESRGQLSASLVTSPSLDEVSPAPLASPPPRPSRAATVRAVADADKAQRDVARSAALCKAFNGQIPSAPAACSQVRP